MAREWERQEQLAREEELLRELDEKLPPMTNELAHTLGALSRLAGFIHEDVDNALRADASEVRQRLEEIARKADTLSGWLRKKADECKECKDKP
ncbi:MAG: hypothetical protein J5I81_06370 [Nitrococcus mobilis]|nr:hypothetical protein [Nitrococcus mobilis]